MKRIVLCMGFALIALGLAFGQSLQDNSYFRESLRLKTMAAEAFDEGDYDAAADYAAQAQEYAALSDEYVAKMIELKAAQDAVDAAGARYDWAVGINAERRYPEAFAAAGGSLAEARTALAAEEFVAARTKAFETLEFLAGLREITPLPAAFVVRDIPGREDCLWRIAELPFVYNDPWQWRVLYRENRAAFPDPNNPDWIEPGMTLRIPSIAGEYREGSWLEGLEYPVFEKK